MAHGYGVPTSGNINITCRTAGRLSLSKILVKSSGISDTAGKDGIWKNFRAEEAVTAAIDLYGPQAATAAAYCALDAWTEARSDDYKFWFGVFSTLKDRKTT